MMPMNEQQNPNGINYQQPSNPVVYHNQQYESQFPNQSVTSPKIVAFEIEDGNEKKNEHHSDVNPDSSPSRPPDWEMDWKHGYLCGTKCKSTKYDSNRKLETLDRLSRWGAFFSMLGTLVMFLYSLGVWTSLFGEVRDTRDYLRDLNSPSSKSGYNYLNDAECVPNLALDGIITNDIMREIGQGSIKSTSMTLENIYGTDFCIVRTSIVEKGSEASLLPTNEHGACPVNYEKCSPNHCIMAGQLCPITSLEIVQGESSLLNSGQNQKMSWTYNDKTYHLITHRGSVDKQQLPVASYSVEKGACFGLSEFGNLNLKSVCVKEKKETSQARNYHQEVTSSSEAGLPIDLLKEFRRIYWYDGTCPYPSKKALEELPMVITIIYIQIGLTVSSFLILAVTLYFMKPRADAERLGHFYAHNEYKLAILSAVCSTITLALLAYSLDMAKKPADFLREVSKKEGNTCTDPETAAVFQDINNANKTGSIINTVFLAIRVAGILASIYVAYSLRHDAKVSRLEEQRNQALNVIKVGKELIEKAKNTHIELESKKQEAEKNKAQAEAENNKKKVGKYIKEIQACDLEISTCIGSIPSLEAEILDYEGRVQHCDKLIEELKSQIDE